MLYKCTGGTASQNPLSNTKTGSSHGHGKYMHNDIIVSYIESVTIRILK